MVANVGRSTGKSLRHELRRRTRGLHDRLDAALGAMALGEPAAYARFLCAQYAARAPIERWAAGHLDDELCPPATADLLAADLAGLGVALPAEEQFEFRSGADSRGLAWAVGGSSLGNKALLQRRRRAGLDGADSFLSDTSTAAYFRRMLPELEQAAPSNEVEAATAAAQAVFCTFLAAASRAEMRIAA